MSFQVFYDDLTSLREAIEQKMSTKDSNSFGDRGVENEKTQFNELLVDVADLAQARSEDSIAIKLRELQDDPNYSFSRIEGPQLIAKILRVQRVMKTFGEHLFADKYDVRDWVGVKESLNHSDIKTSKNFTKQVFIVHGHDEALLSQVARLVEKLGLEVVVLREKADQGKTIIEKFEKHADVGFAIILMTADDMGANLKDAEINNFRSRARQNVILELGYFAASLSRSRMCVLKSEGVEEPSDILGLVYTTVDKAKAWEYKLANELKSAGYEVDLNSI